MQVPVIEFRIARQVERFVTDPKAIREMSNEALHARPGREPAFTLSSASSTRSQSDRRRRFNILPTHGMMRARAKHDDHRQRE